MGKIATALQEFPTTNTGSIGISAKPVAESLDLPESMSTSDNIQEESTLPYHVEYMKLPQKSSGQCM